MQYLESSYVIISQTMTAMIQVTIDSEFSHTWACDWYIYIWPWPILKVKFKVTDISTINILEMVTDTVKITIAMK